MRLHRRYDGISVLAPSSHGVFISGTQVNVGSCSADPHAPANHCDDGEACLQEIDLNLTATRTKSELERHRSLLVQEPEIVAAYLNPQLPKPTDPIYQAKLMLTIRAVLQRRYSVEMASQEPQLSEDDGHSLFATLLEPKSGAVRPTVGDEVYHYISMGVASASSFIDAIQWWIARK
jgi:hypothetical protein